MRLLPAFLLALGAMACGRSSNAQGAKSEPSSAAKPDSASSSGAMPALAPSLEIDTTKLTKTESGLRMLDVTVGKGAVAEAGKKITVHYTLYQPDGTKTESSRDGGEPFSFELGSGQVIRGWDEGVAGMKVGGRRKLVVPPDMAYGDATLVFDIELLGVE